MPGLVPLLLLLTALGTGVWPVADPHQVSGFRPPDHAWASGHRGIDLAATTGDAIRAMADGTVAFVGTIGGKPVVTVRHADGRRTTYEPVRASVTVGTPVRAGDPIGQLAAAGGHCGGTRGCLHVGLRQGDAYLDPRSLVTRASAVLKPD